MQSKGAFTLVELSIVLVILGLLVGGVLSGQSLIRAAELRSITTEKDRYVTALYAFRDKYLALPGDMPNAFDFWGATCGDNDAVANTGCNGDGDGSIIARNNATSDIPLEHIKAWEHLALAGLIEGSYDGVGVGTGDNELGESNTPASKLSSAYWMLNYFGGDAGLGGLDSDNPQRYGLFLMLGSLNNSWQVDNIPGMANSEAWNVDKKIDDGQATTGRLLGRWDEGDCADYDTNGDPALRGIDAYGIAATSNSPSGNCRLHFILQ